jgi:flavin-dependent dehydrogenase
MRNFYDVIIVGAGPAGCELARDLSKTNLKILLVDQVKSFYDNNFSSAGTPISFFKEFDVDESVIGAKCSKLTINGPDFHKTWASNEYKTAVMDFSKLREYLAEKAQARGVELKLGFSYKDYKEIEDGNLEVLLDDKRSENDLICFCKVLVDATGPTRAIMDKFNHYNWKYFSGVGKEYLIKSYKEFDEDNLQFFLRSDFLSKGYGWIFPMGDNQYKVGSAYVAEFVSKKQKDPIDLEVQIKTIIHDYMKISDGEYELIDDHGGTLIYNILREDTYHKDKVIGVGDVVSTVHPLGGEGIRYAMRNARLASKHIQRYLNNKVNHFKAYRKEAKNYLKWKYRLSVFLGIVVYGLLDRKLVHWGLSLIEKCNYEELLEILFNNHYALKTAFSLIFKKEE